MTKTLCNHGFLERNTSTITSTKIPVRKYYIFITKNYIYDYVSKSKNAIRLRPPAGPGVGLRRLVAADGSS